MTFGRPSPTIEHMKEVVRKVDAHRKGLGLSIKSASSRAGVCDTTYHRYCKMVAVAATPEPSPDPKPIMQVTQEQVTSAVDSFKRIVDAESRINGMMDQASGEVVRLRQENAILRSALGELLVNDLIASRAVPDPQ
jgi:hypothetical protein